MPCADSLQHRTVPLTGFFAIVAVFFLTLSVCRAQDRPIVQSPAGQSADEPLAQYINAHPGLLEEFGHLLQRMQNELPFPSPRSESRLLPLLPVSTISVGAFPNYGDVAHQALEIFHQELQKSPALRDIWQHGEMATVGPRIESYLEKFYQLSEYLGQEIVFSASLDAGKAGVLLLAEIRKPGLKDFLRRTQQELADKSKPAIPILDPQELNATEALQSQDAVILVRPDFLLAASDFSTLRSSNSRLDQKSYGFVSTPFGRRVTHSYDGGLTALGAIDLHSIVSQLPSNAPGVQSSLSRSGFSDVNYLVWERKSMAGRTVSQMELSFSGPRRGAAAWLAKPAPMGGLDFASPKAMMLLGLNLADPVQIFEDVKELEKDSTPNVFAAIPSFEQAFHINVKDDLLSQFGGEIVLEFLSATPPKPVWRAMVQIKNSERVRNTLDTLLAASHLPAQQSENGGFTYFSLQIPSAQPIELHYAFVDGYLVVASSTEALTEAVTLHRDGGSLAKSQKFLASLPAGHGSDFSAVLYQDPVATTALRLRQVSPALAASLGNLAGETSPVVICAYGEDTAIREANNSGLFDVAGILMVSAVAIPNLLRSKIAANEASAVGSIRTVVTAQVTYGTKYPERDFAPDLATLGPDANGSANTSADHASLISETLANSNCTSGAWCTKSGFRFNLSAQCYQHLCDAFVVVASPVSSGDGGRSFCATEEGIIRYKSGDPLLSPVSAAECRSWSPLE
jgi:type IV pilus assembly protein PilA